MGMRICDRGGDCRDVFNTCAAVGRVANPKSANIANGDNQYYHCSWTLPRSSRFLSAETAAINSERMAGREKRIVCLVLKLQQGNASIFKENKTNVMK